MQVELRRIAKRRSEFLSYREEPGHTPTRLNLQLNNPSSKFSPDRRALRAALVSSFSTPEDRRRAMLSTKIRDSFPNPPLFRAHAQQAATQPGDAVRGALPALQLLLVDDDPASRHTCAEIARRMGYEIHPADSITAARAFLQRYPVDLILLDLKLPGGAGLMLLSELRTLYPESSVVVMTAFATVNSAVQAMRTGANDYLTKPFSVEELTSVLERSAQRRHFDMESRQLRERLRTQKGKGNLIGRTPEMEKLYRILSKVAFTSHPVLILGESGTGKEVVARTIHFNGPSAERPFIPVDCGSLVPTLIESELFGYVKGAFTGANKSRDGLLVAADGGTVFLDEIGELPLDLQAKLLRSLQEKEVRPVGATHAVPISARILAATNRDLTQMVEQGRFRKDLFFRLNVVNLRIPPLRDRKPDIALLAANVLERMRHDTGTTYTLADDALRLMMDYNWPGNVRELEHAIERACALSSGPVLHMGDFPTQLQNFHFQRDQDGISDPLPEASAPQVVSIAEMEKQAILGAIKQLNGDKLMAARLLGIGKTTLYRKLKEYGIESDQEEV
jgi:DNA-binding NtrC family response regulator